MPSFVHARIRQKWGGGLYAGLLHFRVTTNSRPSNTMWARDLFSLRLFGGQNEKDDKVRHIMTQIASLLAVATVFIGLWTLFTSQGGPERNHGYGSVEKIRTRTLT